jgi:hypothetical protein
LVNSGEMLLVLGRPGRQACPFVPLSLCPSGCSTGPG